MYWGKHFVIILLFSYTAFAQDLNLRHTVYELLQKHRYVLIKTLQNYDFEFDFKTGNEKEIPSEYEIIFSMGSKNFEHEHGHHLSVFVNDFKFYVDKYDSQILLEDGVIYFLDENGEIDHYIDDDQDEYDYLQKFMPVFSDLEFSIHCPNYAKQGITDFIERLDINFNQQTLSETDRKYSDFFIDLSTFLDKLNAQECYGSYP